MKKIFVSLLAIAAIASCAKTEDVYTEGDSEIKLSPVAALQTKSEATDNANYLGAVDGIVYPTQENFDVYAYWKNVPAGESFEDGTIFLEDEVAGGVEFTNKGNYWGGLKNYYWPKNGSLRFAAYSPSHLEVEHTLANDLYEVAYEQPYETAKTWDFLVARTSPSYSLMTAAEKVAIEFEHALSWITLKVVAKDADAAMAFDIKKVTINSVFTKADFAAEMGNGIQVSEWDNQSDPKSYVVFEGSQKVTEVLTNIENTVAGTIVIPQNTTTVTIDFDQYGVNGTADTPGMTVTLDLVLDTDKTPWEPGKHYNYNLVFGLDEILINPSVADWTEVEVGELDVDASNVTTEAQLKAAVAKGGKVTLQSDIVLSKTLTISADAITRAAIPAQHVVLDLNGKTISYESDAMAHSYMIGVPEGSSLRIIDSEGTGKISYKYTGAGDPNFTWGSYTIENRGELYVEAGTIELLCDLNTPAQNIHMYCPIQQASGHTAISGGVISCPTYRSVRVNHGTLAIYGGKMVGQVWMQPYGANTALTIKGGSFEPTGGDGSSVFVTNNQYNVALAVSGGEFATKIGCSDFTKEGVAGSVSGGVFGAEIDAALIAEGYSFAQQGSEWVVVEGDFDVVAENFDDLVAAVKEGENVLFADDFTATSTGSNGYGKTGLSQTKGGVIDGNGNDFACPSANGTWDSAISTTGGTIKNINIVEGFRGIFIKNGTEKVYLENVTIDGTTYTISCDSAGKQGLEARNCTFKGWTSYAATLGDVYFNGCSFGEGNGYSYCRPYAPTVFEDCDFEEGFEMDPRAEVSFVNCRLNGVALTTDNIATLVTSNVSKVVLVK